MTRANKAGGGVEVTEPREISNHEYLALMREREPDLPTQSEWRRVVTDGSRAGAIARAEMLARYPHMPPSYDAALMDPEGWDCQHVPRHGVLLRREDEGGGDLFVRRWHSKDEGYQHVLMPIKTDVRR